jgi:prevent-host-death family protein
MSRASISEAKARLSALLDRVRAGESVTITDRGVPVARIVRAVAPDSGDEEARLRRLERAGVIRRPSTPVDLDWLLGRPLPTPRASVLAALLEERHGRDR